MEFHEKLKELRKQRSLTQEELAEALYVSRTAISKWESGRGYPNIDTLKIISKYFSVTIDDLLSGNELLNVAEEDNKQRRHRLRDMVYGLLDCSIALFLFLPIYGQRLNGNVISVSLLSLQGVSLYLLIGYYAIVLGMILWGVLTLALQNCQQPLWLQVKTPVSLFLNTLGVMLFMVSQQVYGACFMFVFLLFKAIILIKK